MGPSVGRGKRIRRVLAVAAAAGALALAGSGCISVTEEVLIRPDGSVQYGVDFTMLEMVIQGLAEMSGEDPGKSLGSQWLASADSAQRDSIRLREFVEGKDHHFAAERDLASLEHLAILSSRAEVPDSERVEKGAPGLPLEGIRVTRLDARRVRLVRTLENPSPPGMPAAGGDSTDARTKRMFADRHYVFRLRAPEIESANGVVAKDRKSAEWRIPMTQLAGDSAVVVEAILVAGKPR